MAIKGKSEELLLKQVKISERNRQKLTDSIKRPNLRIIGIEEGEEVQAKGICNILNKIIKENFPSLEKTMPIQDTNGLEQNRTTPQHVIIKKKNKYRE
jgi:hypothetical protein